ncbi:histidine phosphatase family protein [Lacticaseibacillus baoqingensis]|uniref:Histidine phosphatase family protein n=1 Tax=Lacticaseibacillus baoqingensis TaxID=2486013 RepID=A0ABW4EA85_9LACO|nr:histidine phosphatase family protein [Lacticaseibacillus baoqingensis]
MTTFYFIRHGQTTANAMGLKQGTINDERTHLTAKGRQQAARLAGQFDLRTLDALYVSPLARTQETAAILNQQAKLPPQLDPRLLEISYGSWDGQVNAELEAAHPRVFDPLLHDVLPSYVEVAQGGESFTQVQTRVAEFMQAVAAQLPDAAVACVTHGFTVKAAALAALAPRSAMTLPEPDNTSVTKLTLTAGRYYLWYYNRFDAHTY